LINKKKVKEIGIIGAGGVGLCNSLYLSSKFKIILYQREGNTHQIVKQSIKNKKIKLNFSDEVIPFKYNLENISLTKDLNDISTCNLIFICTGYTSHKEIGLKLAEYKWKKNKRITVFPGKLGSSYLLKDCSEISSSVFGVRRDIKSSIENGIILNILNKKNKLKFSAVNTEKNKERIEELNEIYGKDTFINGEHVLKVGLQNHDYSLNVASMCSIANFLINSDNNKIKNPIYKLGPKYTKILELNFYEKQKIANKFGWKLSSIEEWLRNRNNNLNEEDLYTLLKESYQDHKFLVTPNNRRLNEDPWAIILLQDLAKKLNISCPGTDTLVRDILKLRRKLGLPNNIGYYFKDLDIKIEALMKNIN